MPTPDDVLNIERRWLNARTKEIPNGTNRVKGITDWWGLHAAWCGMFQMRCLTEAGVIVGPGEKGAAWVSATIGWYRDRGRAFTDARRAQPGDLVAFEWGTTAGGYDHIGMVESVRRDGLICIEGNVGNRVQRLFRSWASGMAEFARPHYDSAPVPTFPTDLNVPTAVWRQGSSGPYVRQIQRLVGVTPDGRYGPKTAAAVRVWQSKLGVPVDGAWGPATQEATNRLFAYLAVAESPAPDTSLNAFLVALANATQKVLRMGSGGDAVKMLQMLLEKKLIPVGAIDGVFGPATNHAVIHFQRTHGLVADGVVGPATWAALVR